MLSQQHNNTPQPLIGPAATAVKLAAAQIDQAIHLLFDAATMDGATTRDRLAGTVNDLLNAHANLCEIAGVALLDQDEESC